MEDLPRIVSQYSLRFVRNSAEKGEIYLKACSQHHVLASNWFLQLDKHSCFAPDDIFYWIQFINLNSVFMFPIIAIARVRNRTDMFTARLANCKNL